MFYFIADAASDGVARDNYNELKITVLNCSQLKSSSNSQPSPLVPTVFHILSTFLLLR